MNLRYMNESSRGNVVIRPISRKFAVSGMVNVDRCREVQRSLVEALLARPRVHTRDPLAWRRLHRLDRYGALQVAAVGKAMIGGMLRGEKRAARVVSLAIRFFGCPRECNVMHGSRSDKAFGLLKRPHFRASSHSTTVSLLLRPQDMMMASKAPEPA